MEECFEDLTPYIHAVETGLSSDPPMNWRFSALDRFQLISNSDAHSPAKLGREANLLDIEMSYQGLYKAIQEGEGLEGTIEFFPRKENIILTGTGNVISALLRKRLRLMVESALSVEKDHHWGGSQSDAAFRQGRWRSPEK